MLQHKVNTCCLHLFTPFIHVVKIVVQDCDFKWILLPLYSINFALIKCRSVNNTKGSQYGQTSNVYQL